MSNIPTFEQLCEQYRPVLRSVVEARIDRRLLQRMDPSDIVQEALIEAFSRFEEFQMKKPMPLAAWLRETTIQQLRIACRRHRQAARRSVLRQVSYDQSSVFRLAEQMTAVCTTAEDHHQGVEEAERAWKCIDSLPAIDREVLLLRYINGLSNQATADLLGVSETVASKRHCRALLRLQERLQDRASD